ncbi:MAG: pyridoxamine 5'-phosphate oxidase family protein [Clostridia bacterium]|nr:pyridoxamine 5'-phosphate oxidase family protein [Clostridia bacterium]
MFRELARKKQALSQEECIDILKREPRGVLSVLGDDGYPYGMPMNFLYDNGKIYFHSGKKGHKVDAISRENKVSFCVFDDGYRNEGEWALNISSVIVFGKIRVIEDVDQTVDICRRLSLKFTDDLDYIEKEIASFAKATLCFELTPEHITGKLVNEA